MSCAKQPRCQTPREGDPALSPTGKAGWRCSGVLANRPDTGQERRVQNLRRRICGKRDDRAAVGRVYETGDAAVQNAQPTCRDALGENLSTLKGVPLTDGSPEYTLLYV
jgi:hypothetical protein